MYHTCEVFEVFERHEVTRVEEKGGRSRGQALIGLDKT